MTGGELEFIEALLQTNVVQLLAVAFFVGVVLLFVTWFQSNRQQSTFNNRLLTFIGSTNTAIDAMRESVERNETAWTRLIQQTATLREAEIVAKDNLSDTLNALNTTVSGVPGQLQAGLDTHQTQLAMEMAAHKARVEEISTHVTQMIDLVSVLNDGMRNLSMTADGQHGQLLTALTELHGDVRKIKRISEEIERETEYDADGTGGGADRAADAGGGGGAGAGAGPHPPTLSPDGRGGADGGGDRIGAGRGSSDGERNRSGGSGGGVGSAAVGGSTDGSAKRTDVIKQSGG